MALQTSTNVVNVLLKASADFKEANKAVKDLTQKIVVLQTKIKRSFAKGETGKVTKYKEELKKAKEEKKRLTRALKESSKELKGATAAMRRDAAEVLKGRNAWTKYVKILREIGETQRKLTAARKKYIAQEKTIQGKSQLKHTAAEISNLSAKMEQLQKDGSKVASTFTRFAQNMHYVGNLANQLAIRFAALTVAMLGGIGIAVKAFMDIEKSSDQLQASISGLAEGEFEGLNEQLLQLTLVMPIAAQEILTMARSAAEAGVSTKNLVGFTRVLAMLMEVTGEMDVDTVAKDIRGMMIVFNMAEEQVLNMASALRLVAKQSSVGADEIVQATMNAANTANAARVSFAETIGIIQILTQHYSSASRAGTSLRNIFLEMLIHSDKLGEVLENQGTIVQELNEDAYAVLLKYLEKVNEEGDITAKADFVNKVFSRRAVAGVLAVADNIEEIEVAVAGANAEMTEAKTLVNDYETATSNLADQFQILKNQGQYALMEIGKVFAEELLPMVMKLQDHLLTIIMIWKNLSDEAKKSIASFMLLTTVILGAATVVLTLIKTFSIFGGLIGQLLGLLMSIGELFPAAIAAGISPILVAIMAIAALIAITLLWATILKMIGDMLGKNWDILSKLRTAISTGLQLDRVKAQVAALREEFQAAGGDVGNLNEEFEEMGKAGEGAANKIIAAFDTFGRSFMENFIYLLKEADWQLLDSTTAIAEQYYDILKKQGRMTEQQVSMNSMRMRESIAQAIIEFRKVGEISQATREAIISTVGRERGMAIIEELVAGMNFAILQEVVEAISDELETVKAEMKEKVEVINQQIKDIEDFYAADIEAQEDILKALKKQKKDLERAYKKDVKAYNDRVDLAKDEYELAKDEYDDVKDQNDAEEDLWKGKIEIAKEALDDQKDLLKKWQDLRKKELAVAKGRTAWAELSYDASRRELEILTAMGRDEFDAQFRATKNQTKIYASRVDLAQEQETLAERMYSAEEEAAESRIAILEAEYETLSDQLEVIQKINEEVEGHFEAIAQNARDRLELEEEALKDFREMYEDQMELLEEEIEIHEELLEGLTEARDAQTKILKKQKTELEELYQVQIDALEDRKELADAELEEARDFYQKQQHANDERLKIQDRMNSSATDMSRDISGALGKLPGVINAAGAGALSAVEGIGELVAGALGMAEDIMDGWTMGEGAPTFLDTIAGFLEQIALGLGKPVFMAIANLSVMFRQDWFKKLNIGQKLKKVMEAMSFQIDPVTGDYLGMGEQGEILGEMQEGYWGDELITMMGEWWETNAKPAFLGMGGKIILWIIEGIEEKINDMTDSGEKVLIYFGLGFNQEGKSQAPLLTGGFIKLLGKMWELIGGPKLIEMGIKGLKYLGFGFNKEGKFQAPLLTGGFIKILGKMWDLLGGPKLISMGMRGAVFLGLGFNKEGKTQAPTLVDRLRGYVNYYWVKHALPHFSSLGIRALSFLGSGFLYNAYNTIKGWVSTIKTVLLYVFFMAPWSLGKSLYSWGTSLISSFASGITSSFSITKIVNAAKTIAWWIKYFLRITSPAEGGPLSTLDEWGGNLVRTYADAMKKAQPKLEAAVVDMATTIATGITVIPQSQTAANTAATIVNESTTDSSRIITQDNSVHFHTPQILATDGELRVFTRKIQDFMDEEDLRRGNLAT